MKALINQYGWVRIDQYDESWFTRHIHPDFRDPAHWAILRDNLFQCLEIHPDSFLKLQSTETELVLGQELFHPMPKQTPFLPGIQVKFLTSKGKLQFGKIFRVHWHSKENRHFYTIEMKGKLKSRRFYDHDLDLIEA